MISPGRRPLPVISGRLSLVTEPLEILPICNGISSIAIGANVGESGGKASTMMESDIRSTLPHSSIAVTSIGFWPSLTDTLTFNVLLFTSATFRIYLSPFTTTISPTLASVPKVIFIGV